MKVYHGSYTGIKHIDFALCKPFRDFGKGFYVTKIRTQAEYWAERRGRKYNNKGCVTEFDFSEAAFENWDFRVRRFDIYTEEWLDFVVMNRNEDLPVPAHDYDIVEGPVANDDITNRIDDYLSGLIDKTNFLEELKFHRPTHQICLCTHRSLQAIKLIDNKPIQRIDDTLIASLITDYNLTEEKAIDFYFNSGTYANLIDEDTKFYLKKWTEIYQILKCEFDEKVNSP